jgi:hypothetical protein
MIRMKPHEHLYYKKNVDVENDDDFLLSKLLISHTTKPKLRNVYENIFRKEFETFFEKMEYFIILKFIVELLNIK